MADSAGQKSIIDVTEVSSISSGDNIYINQGNALKQIDYDQLADAILNKLTTKSYSDLDTTAKTFVGAIDELNSKSITSETVTTTSTREFSFPGNSVLVQIMRNSIGVYALIAFDYWESDYKILYGTVPDFVVIEKDSQSSSLKITNNHQNSITVLIV